MVRGSIVVPLLGIFFFVVNAQRVRPPGIGGESTVLLVNTVFRHGDRTPDSTGAETFPTDPLRNNTFYPVGVGMLTNRGKRRAYELGQLFRKRYDKLLGPNYWQPLLTARSTSIIRSKMTLQLVLASMFAPSPTQKWNPILNWQPANMISLPITRDGLLLPFICPTYLEATEELRDNEELTAKIKKFDNLRAYLSEKTGKHIRDPMDMFLLYHSFAARTLMGISLPAWIKTVFPNGELREATSLQYQMSSYTPVLNRRNGGLLLRRMIRNMEDKINGTAGERKFHLYSAQDVTVAAMLNALGLYTDQIPAFCSSVIIELHRIDGSYYVKVLYNLGIPQQVVEMKIAGCTVLCPFKEFTKLLEHVIPTGNELQCDYPEPDEI